jgi:acetyl esterase/lipase
VFSLNYRLTPEHPCPAAIEDARAGWDWLCAQGYDATNIFVGGDSAGGGLTLALLQNLRDSGEAVPGAAFLYSPWTDLACTGQSHAEIGDRDAMFTPETIRSGGPRYAGDLPLTDPRVSPLYGDMSGLPPMIVFASRDELLRDDATRLVEKARAAGVEVEAHFEDGLVHVWPLFSPLMPESKTTLRQTTEFIRRR